MRKLSWTKVISIPLSYFSPDEKDIYTYTNTSQRKKKEVESIFSQVKELEVLLHAFFSFQSNGHSVICYRIYILFIFNFTINLDSCNRSYIKYKILKEYAILGKRLITTDRLLASV